MPSILILAGGRATRLYPVTKIIPKSMVKVAGKPFIAHQLDLLKRNGFRKVVICSGYLSKQIENFVGNGSRFGLSVHFSRDGRKLLETGGAIKKALSLLTDVFFVMYGDSYLDIDFQPIIGHFLSHDKKGLMVIFKNKNKWDKSNVLCKNGNIIKYNKNSSDRKIVYIDYGLSIFRKSAFDEIGRKKIFDLVTLHKILIRKKQLLGFEAKKRPYEIGSPLGLKETGKYLLKSYK